MDELSLELVDLEKEMKRAEENVSQNFLKIRCKNDEKCFIRILENIDHGTRDIWMMSL